MDSDAKEITIVFGRQHPVQVRVPRKEAVSRSQFCADVTEDGILDVVHVLSVEDGMVIQIVCNFFGGTFGGTKTALVAELRELDARLLHGVCHAADVMDIKELQQACSMEIGRRWQIGNPSTLRADWGFLDEFGADRKQAILSTPMILKWDTWDSEDKAGLKVSELLEKVLMAKESTEEWIWSDTMLAGILAVLSTEEMMWLQGLSVSVHNVVHQLCSHQPAESIWGVSIGARRWKIGNWSQLDGCISSQPFELKGEQWYRKSLILTKSRLFSTCALFSRRLLVFPRGNRMKDLISLYLDCPKASSRHRPYARFSLGIVNQTEVSKSVFKGMSFCFCLLFCRR